MIIFSIEIFSVWIFIWFILYYLHIININPLLYLIIAFIITLFELFILIIKGATNMGIFIFMGLNIIMKIIPIKDGINDFKFLLFIKSIISNNNMIMKIIKTKIYRGP